MNVILAKTAGFCFGVKRAVDMTCQQAEQKEQETASDSVRQNSPEKRIYTYGPIIHNMEVVESLKEKGVFPVEGEDTLKEIEGKTLIIRSHGVSRKIYELAEQYRIRVVDATCPFVKRIHKIAEQDSQNGRRIIIIGDSTHPEVRGIIGWVQGEVTVIGSEQEAMSAELPADTPATVVSQTTFNRNKFNNIVEIINKKLYDIRVINTICNATMERQEEAAVIARQADIMLVVGDRHSSNTRKLFDICRTYCADTYYIQTIEDLDEQILQSGINVGITAGASTPDYIIQEVFLTCQKKKISTR